MLFSNDGIYFEFDKKSRNFYIINENLYDITSKINILNNTYSKQVLPLSKSLITKIPLTGKISYNYKWVIGSLNATHNNDYIYDLPISKGDKVFISQGYDSNFSHKGKSKYATDFKLEVGSPIYAARDGFIVNYEDNLKENCYKVKKECKSNSIIIKHSDNTYSKYSHLQYKGVLVDKGKYVKKGQLIGLSGNTGYSNGPHLHFLVYTFNENLQRVSIPIKFKTTNGLETLIEHKYYQKPF